VPDIQKTALFPFLARFSLQRENKGVGRDGKMGGTGAERGEEGIGGVGTERRLQ